MSRKMGLLALSLLVSALSPPALAQTEEAPEKRLDLEEVRALREQVEGNAALGKELQTGILELYDGAISSLETAAANVTKAAGFERERAGVGRMVETLRAELGRPEHHEWRWMDFDSAYDVASPRVREVVKWARQIVGT